MWKVSQGSPLAVSEITGHSGSREKWVDRRRRGWTIWKHSGNLSSHLCHCPAASGCHPFSESHQPHLGVIGSHVQAPQECKVIRQCPEAIRWPTLSRVSHLWLRMDLELFTFMKAPQRHISYVLKPFLDSAFRAVSGLIVYLTFSENPGCSTEPWSPCPVTRRGTSTDGCACC